MDLRSIRYFVAAAQQLNFGRAAEKMNVVQPAISRRIKHLEEELGILLFERVGNAVILTEAGRQLLPEYRKLLRLAGDCVRVAQHAGKGGDGIVRFAFVDNALSTLLPPLLREFRARHPRVELELEALDRQSQIASLNDRTIDVGLLPEPICEDRFSYQRFVSAPLVVALPQGHRLAARASLRIAELEHEPFILLPAVLRTRIYETVISACAIAGFTPQVVEEASQIHTCLALVDAEAGHDRGQVGPRRFHRASILARPAQVGLLHDVLGIVFAAQQPSGEVVGGIEVRQHRRLESGNVAIGP